MHGPAEKKFNLWDSPIMGDIWSGSEKYFFGLKTGLVKLSWNKGVAG